MGKGASGREWVHGEAGSHPCSPTSWGAWAPRRALPPPSSPLRAAWLGLRGPPMGSDVGPASRTHKPEPAYIRWGLPPSPAPEAWALSGPAGALFQMCFLLPDVPRRPAFQSELAVPRAVWSRSPPDPAGGPPLGPEVDAQRLTHWPRIGPGLWGGGGRGALVGDTHGCGRGCHS